MRLINGKIFASAMVSLFFLAACSDDINESTQKQTVTNQQQDTIPTTTLHFAAQAGFGTETRALDALTFYRGRLRPKFNNGKAEVLMIFGSPDSDAVHKEVKEWTYDSETNTLSFRGDIQVPSALLAAKQSLKMFLVAYPSGTYSSSTGRVTMSKRFATHTSSADGTEMPFAVPYFSGWVDISAITTTTDVDATRTDITFKPQGQIIKVVVQDRQTILSNVMLKGFSFESSIMSQSGYYDFNITRSTVGNDIVYTPDNADGGVTGRYQYNHSLSSPTSFKDAKIYYVWTEARPNVTGTKYTRTFISATYTSPVLATSFATDAWWAQEKEIVANYSTNDLTVSGSTLYANLDNLNGFSPIDRFSHSVASPTNKFSTFDNWGDAQNQYPLNLSTWAAREYTTHADYTWSSLASRNYVGSSPVNITFTNSPDPNSNNIAWRIPTLDEMHNLYPSDSRLGATFRMSVSNAGSPYTISESVKFGSRYASATNVTSSYQFFSNDGAGFKAIMAVRFMSDDNRQKTAYRYRELEPSSEGTARTQIQTQYLGAYYPEITDAASLKNFAGKLPTLEERITPWNRRYWDENKRGNRYWINESTSTTSKYLEIDHLGTVRVVTPLKSNNNIYNSVILIRDLE